jgi:A/G-specific adenine glycosylase
VIRLWAGLGYNRRAVNLQRAARAVLEEYNAVFPRDMAALRALPGIGPYTAGAIACFAFEQDVAFMDTNIRRALRRLFAGADERTATMSDAALLELAQAAVPAGEGWAWNQAIMELGATICSAAAPACWRCPARARCRAYAERQAADEQVFSGEGDLAGAGRGGPALQGMGRRGVAERREESYAGSNRYYRGRAVEALRGLPPGVTITLDALGPQVRPDYGADNAAWLSVLVEGLARDGLARIDEEGCVGLPL